MDFETLAGRITAKPPRNKTRLVAIDGRGGAGKSSLARRLACRIGTLSVVEVDDFWLPVSIRPDRKAAVAEPGSDYDWERLRDQVLVPLSRDEVARYRRYDWRSDALTGWKDVDVGSTVVVEGVFSTRRELTAFYDLCIWVETPEAVCLARGIERDGEDAEDVWENEWMRAYTQYIETSDPQSRADFVVEGR